MIKMKTIKIKRIHMESISMKSFQMKRIHMKRIKMNISIKRIKILVVILSSFILSLLTSAASADFIVKSEHQSPLPYGNAETICFHSAITGRPLTAEEEMEMVQALPLNEIGRFYGRLRANVGILALEQVRNRSKPPNNTFIVSRRHESRSQTGLEIAVGYIWEEDFRGDLEYLVNKTFNYNANPIATNSSFGNFSAQIKNNTLLANVYYDFLIDRFRPYVTGGIGVSENTVSTSLSPVPPPPNTGSSTKRVAGFAWQLGVGFRVSMFSRWFVDASYRYIRLASGLGLQPGDATFRLNGSYSLNAFSFGIIYLF